MYLVVQIEPNDFFCYFSDNLAIQVCSQVNNRSLIFFLTAAQRNFGIKIAIIINEQPVYLPET